MTLRLNGTTSGYSEIDAPAVATNESYILSGIGGVIDRLQRPGNVLQVVNATYSTIVANATNVYADTGLTATIAPTSASSKILVLVSQAGLYKQTGSPSTGISLRLMRGTSSLIEFEKAAGSTATSSDLILSASNTSYLDSPATTSSVTYKTQFKNVVNAATVSVQSNSDVSTITLMEIAA